MKVTLYFVSKDSWVNSVYGLYTEKEFEVLKEKIIEDYRKSDDYTYDITKYLDELLICEAALGKEDSVKEFKETVRIMEEEIIEDFITEYVTEYEKEL